MKTKALIIGFLALGFALLSLKPQQLEEKTQQLITFEGMVTDGNTGEPLAGVKVSFDGQLEDEVVYTGFDGRFVHSAEATGIQNLTVTFSYISYETATLETGFNDPVEVKMSQI